MKILPQIIACVVFGTLLGVVFWLCDGGKPSQEMAVKTYQGQWVEDIIKVGDYWSVGYVGVQK